MGFKGGKDGSTAALQRMSFDSDRLPLRRGRGMGVSVTLRMVAEGDKRGAALFLQSIDPRFLPTTRDVKDEAVIPYSRPFLPSCPPDYAKANTARWMPTSGWRSGSDLECARFIAALFSAACRGGGCRAARSKAAMNRRTPKTGAAFARNRELAIELAQSAKQPVRRSQRRGHSVRL